jgi:hypothetical protein
MTNVPGDHRRGAPLLVAAAFDVEAVKRRPG